MAEPEPQRRLSVLSIWVGIFIPIVAVLIPYVLKYVLPEHKLEYEVVGLVRVDRTTSVELVIRNGGEKPERNVKVWIKADESTRFADELTRLFDQREKGKSAPPEIIVDTKTRFSIGRDSGYHVISLGDLRPRESIKISILLRGRLLIGNYAPEDFSIKSDDQVAEGKESPDLLKFLYPFGFWMFVILMVLIGVYGIYDEYFMDPKKKERMLLEAIDKLRK